MPVTLYVDGPRWRDHLRGVAEASPGIIPVAKGNGYGFTIANLARRAEWLGVDTVAVGTYREINDVERRFPGDIMVLEPWRPFLDAPAAGRLVHTIGRLEDLAAIADAADRPRVVLEALTSMRRHGLTASELEAAIASHPSVRIEGLAPASSAGRRPRRRGRRLASHRTLGAVLSEPRRRNRTRCAPDRASGRGAPATRRHVAVARRPRRIFGAGHGARRASGAAWRSDRLPPAQGRPRRSRDRGVGWHCARHCARSTGGGRVAASARGQSGEGRARSDWTGTLAVLGRWPTTLVCRATAHAGEPRHASLVSRSPGRGRRAVGRRADDDDAV